MKRKNFGLTSWLIPLAILFTTWSISFVARGQRGDSDALILARVFVHEAGWDVTTGEMEAIYAVLDGGATRYDRTFRSYAYAYSGRALRGETAKGVWVSDLDEEGTRPDGWPEWVECTEARIARAHARGEECERRRHPAWSNFRDRWLAALAHAERVVSGEVTHSCSSPPHDWGGRVDRRRARRLHLIRISCGETRNDFYLRPSLVGPTADPAPPDAGPSVDVAAEDVGLLALSALPVE